MYVMNLGLVLVLSVIPVVTELFLIRNLTVNHILILFYDCLTMGFGASMYMIFYM